MAARRRVRAAAAGEAARTEDLVLAILLRETDFLHEVLGERVVSRRVDRTLDAGRHGLPEAERAILDTLTERRKRGDKIGTWMADD